MVLSACSKDENTSGNFRDALFIDSEHVEALGSYVQGTELNQYSTVTVPYNNAKGGSATVSAPESNGMSIAQQNVQMTSGDGEFTVAVSGMPIELKNTFLQLNIAYGGVNYISSVEIPVMMDPDPTGVITFNIDQNDILSLTGVTEIEFTVNPSMAAVVLSSATIPGLAVKVEQDMTAGTGKVILTPSALFFDGQIGLTATFGVRPTQSASFKVNGFESGDGLSSSTPYVIAKKEQFSKIANGLGKHYKLSADLALGAVSPIAGAFTGSLNGNSKSVSYTVNTPTADNAALFASLGSGASVSSLTLTGSVTGQDNVAALAAANNGATVTTVTASGVTITGRNNVALLCATGTGADAAVLSFASTPTSINITQGTTSAASALGITPVGATVTVDLKTTGLKSGVYNTSDGKLTLTMPDVAGNFVPGNISFTAKLPSAANVSSSARTIDVKSEKMYESGTGTSGDPYMVNTGDQLYATMSTYPAACIELMGNVTLPSWTPIATFTGDLDGAGYTASGLNASLTTNLSSPGVIHDLKLTGVSISTSSASVLGAVADNLRGGTIRNVAVMGTLTSTAASGDKPLGGIVGDSFGGTIDNCYANVTIASSVSAVGGIMGRINAPAGGVATTISNCTSAGSITMNGNLTKIGGILGRKQTGLVTGDVVRNCLSSMVIASGTGDTGSNMVGGIFGALQANMTNPPAISIDQCMFTGRVTGNNNIGGIGGVCPQTTNCIVVGAGASATQSTVGANVGGSVASSGGIASGAKGDLKWCIVANSRITGPASTTKYAAGIASCQNNGTPAIVGCVVINSAVNNMATAGDNTTGGRAIAGLATNLNLTSANNYYKGLTYADGSAFQPIGGDVRDGAEGPALMDQAWYTTLGYNFTEIWQWDAANSRPALRNAGCAASVIPAI